MPKPAYLPGLSEDEGEEAALAHLCEVLEGELLEQFLLDTIQVYQAQRPGVPASLQVLQQATHQLIYTSAIRKDAL